MALDENNGTWWSTSFIKDKDGSEGPDHLKHGLEDHGVALYDLPQGDELWVGAQEVQGPSSVSPSACRSLPQMHMPFVNPHMHKVHACHIIDMQTAHSENHGLSSCGDSG